MFNPYFPQIGQIIKNKPVAGDVNLLTVVLPEQKSFKFNSGQFVMAGIAGWGEAPFDICSNPLLSGKFFEIAVRRMGRLTDKLYGLKLKDKITVRGPFGNGFPADTQNKELLLIAGGSGFVTFRSIITSHAEAIKSGREHKPTVLLGVRDENVLLFKDEYKDWDKIINFYAALEKPISKKAVADVCSCQVSTGLVTSILDKININSEMLAFLCGPPIMYKFVVAKLLEKGIKEENIYLSLERRMHCGIGVCQHCAIGDKYVCKDGPVFQYSELKGKEIF